MVSSFHSLYLNQLFWVWSRFLLLLAHKMCESDTVGLPQGQQGKYHAGCCIYLSCKAADVTLKAIDVETQDEARQTIQRLVEIQRH